jgi:hypothetical protein
MTYPKDATGPFYHGTARPLPPLRPLVPRRGRRVFRGLRRGPGGLARGKIGFFGARGLYRPG